MSTSPGLVGRGMGVAASTYLDALRAIAANLVIASHVLGLYCGIRDPWSLGNLGVAVFFLLSGLLIMQSMLGWSQRPEPRLPGFLADRAARILTPYIPALVLIGIANLLFIATEHGAGGTNRGPLAFVGNLLLLQDHSAFQMLEIAGIDLAWRIRPYNAAEPFWTIAIEMWIYVAMGLFFFCLVRRERVHRGYALALALASVPVVVWNAAAGGGKSLSLIWIVGAIAGLLFHLWRDAAPASMRSVAGVLIACGALALVGRAGKVGFQPYDLQTATLLAIVMFGILAWLMTVQDVALGWQRLAGFLASYSYSLYLVHNTALIIVLEHFEVASSWVRVTAGVLLAHCCAYLLYLAFERRYRTVGRWLRPWFERALRPRLAARSPLPSTPVLSATTGRHTQ
jgi:peptidoglycan/LPS O-acetylase OafA/YrhL